MSAKNDLSAINVSEDDIAIIGMSCRYPGDVNSPENFWEFLLAGGDGIVDVPADRWENKAYYDADKDKKNKMYVNCGGFIKNIDQFDPLFFGISPKEAPQIDPQHRWLLELTYEVFENSGLKISELKGSDTAVYIGQFMHDYEQLQLDSMAHDLMNSHSATGPSMTLTSNRISYSFDFTGPSVTLDTACSSSLVALDLACKAILNGDSKLAVAGGVNILLRPELTMSICKASMLSPDGRCKSFDASANGYVRSEGAGLVLIKKLSEALRDGDNVLAVIKATGVNQDGQTIGITVPNGDSQKKLLVKTLARAKLSPQDIQYAEAHGTGTAVGDPIEINALGSLLGERSAGQETCVVGSVKSNIGHSEAAAGMAGLIKTVLAMNNGLIPKNIHYHNTNPAIDLESLNIRIAGTPTPWPETQGKPRSAIVNSFGFGGTNSNVVLQQAPSRAIAGIDQAPVINNPIKLLPISSKTEKGLKDQAAKYRDFLIKQNDSAVLENDSAVFSQAADLHDICFTAANHREHHKYRLVASGTNNADVIKALDDFIAAVPSPSYLQAAEKNNQDGKICFVFSGMGTQWAGMGKSLFQSEPVFRAMIERCDAALQPYTGWSLIDVMFNTDNPETIDETHYAQPGIFAIQVALAEQLKAWGIEPSVVVGHSAGEVGAAYVAGALDFDDAIKVAYHRSQLQHTTEGMGKMVAVGLTEEALKPYLAGLEAKVSIGAVNSEDAITLSGDEAALTAIAEKLDEQGIFARFLKVGVPYHSPVMDQLKAPLIAALKDIKVHAPHTPLFSTVSGEITKAGDWGPEYWADNVREPVRFKDAIENIFATGIYTFLEVAPHTALSNSVQKNLQKHRLEGTCVATLKRDQDDTTMLMNTLAALHVNGLLDGWKPLYPNGGTLVSLPNYAWQHARYWSEAEAVQAARIKNVTRRSGFAEAAHPLLGSQFNSSSKLWQRVIDVNELTYLRGHQVENEIVYPGAAYIEMALSVARQQFQKDEISLIDIQFKKAFFLSQEKTSVIETTYDEAAESFLINAVDPQTGEWSTYSNGVVKNISAGSSDEPTAAKYLDRAALQKDLTSYYNQEEFYQHCHALGLTYRDAFQLVEQSWFVDDKSLVEINVPESLVSSLDEYLLHPCILDGAFQGLFPTIQSGFLPTGIAALNYYKKPDAHAYAYLNTTYKDEESIRGDIAIFSTSGEVFVEILGVELKSTKTQHGAGEQAASILYDFAWHEEAIDNADAKVTQGKWIVFADANGVAKELAAELEYRAQEVCIIERGTEFNKVSDNHYILNAQSEHDVVAVLNQFSKTSIGIIYLWGIDNNIDETQASAAVLENCVNDVVAPVYIVQALDRVEWKHSQKLFFVTRTVQQLGTDTALPQAAQASLWGFARVLASESPDLKVSLIDLPESIDDDLIAQLAHEITHTHYEQEVALRSSARYVNRLRLLGEKSLNAYAELQTNNPANASFTLQKAVNGNVKLVESNYPLVSADNVVIKVDVASLAQEHIDDLSLFSQQNVHVSELSYIAIGTVLAKDSSVTTVNTGDKVIALVTAQYASVVSVPATAIIQVKDLSTSFVSAIASAFLTAHYALNYLSQLQAGEKVLVHEAANSIGLAVLQLAAIKQATVFATANTEEKRNTLRAAGIVNVFDSNDYQLAATIHSASGGQGLDVVVNTTSDKYAHKILALLKPAGRFIDLDKQQKNKGSTFFNEILSKNLSYHSVNYKDLISYRPELSVSLIKELLAYVQSGLLTDAAVESIALNSFAVARIEEAVAYLDAENEFSIAAINFDSSASTEKAVAISQGFQLQPIKANYTYLVTGGLGGLGLEVMDWLVDGGATSVVLIGRSSPSAEAQSRIDQVRARNVVVEVMAADVTKEEDVTRVFTDIEQRLQPLKGIIHSAGVLDDGVITQQTEERFRKVLAPKVKGAWNLHRASLALDLDMFICFSSIASIVGWAGQSNYAAANAFMDVLAYRRRALGKAALTINWGPWSGSGMAANLDARDIQRMNDAGMAALDAEQGLSAMTELLTYRVPQAGVFDLTWDKIFKQYPDPTQKTLFKDFIVDDSQEKSVSFIDQLLLSDAADHPALLSDKIAELLADILGIESVSVIDKSKNVFEYGVNSLMAMDFKNRLQAILKIKLPATLVLKYPTVNAMAAHILDNLLVEVLAGETEIQSDVLMWDPKNPDVVFNNEINGSLPTYTLSIWNWMLQEKSARFNIGFIIAFNNVKFDLDVVKKTLNVMFTYHDGTRLQFYKENGEYKNQIVSLGGGVPVEEHDYSDMEYGAAIELMEKRNNELHDSFSFEQPGALYRVAYYKLNDENPHRLFVIFHHYLADGASQKVFGEDFERVYLNIYNSEPVYFPPKSYGLLNWTQQLLDFSNGQAVEQLPYWKDKVEQAKGCVIPTDYPLVGQRKLNSFAEIGKYFISKETFSGLEKICNNENLEIADIINYALVRAFSSLSKVDYLWVDLVTHMRVGAFENIEIPRVFAQVAECTPTMFELNPELPLSSQFKSLKVQREDVPNRGLGLRCLRFINQGADTQVFHDRHALPQFVLNVDLNTYIDKRGNNWSFLTEEAFGIKEVMTVEKDLSPDFYLQVTLKGDGLELLARCFEDTFDVPKVVSVVENMVGILEKVAENFYDKEDNLLDINLFTEEKVD